MQDILLEIPEDNPFKNDAFNREVIARNFMKIFELDQEGIILSIDSSWGTGKTTFIKMWETLINNDLEYKDKYETLYFNAWDNDYIKDPLLAILTEIQINEESNSKELFKNIKNKGKKLVKPIVSTGLKVVTSGIVNLDNVDLEKIVEDELPGLAEKIGDSLFEEAIESKKTREIFKDYIEEEQRNTGKKIIFFIDELDRCRPIFAIELLEVIKHLFSTKGVIFVISLDKEQLGYSIKNIYGENMNVDGYLRRFFDLDFKLPMPDKKVYFYEKYRKILSGYSRNVNLEKLRQFLCAFIREYNFSLRDIDKMLFYIKNIIPLIDEFHTQNDINASITAYLYSYLISLKIKDSNLYRKIIELDYGQTYEEIKETFKLNEIKDMNFRNEYDEHIQSEQLLNVLNKEVLVKFLKALKYVKETYNADLNIGEYRIMFGENGPCFKISNLFYNKECKIIKNLEFMNALVDRN